MTHSSGGGWTNNQSMPSLSSSSSLVSALDSQCTPLKSTVFNDVETNNFIEIFKVDTENLKKECSHPFLLHCFRNTLNNECKFEVA